MKNIFFLVPKTFHLFMTPSKMVVKYITVVIMLFAFSCSDDDSDSSDNSPNIQNLSSELCEEISGYTAFFWDYAHGILQPVLTQPPVVTNPGGQFIHSQYPALGYVLPQGFTATESAPIGSQTIGANVISNDNTVVSRYVPLTSFFNVAIPAIDILNNEISLLQNFYQSNSQIEVICETSATNTLAGEPSQFEARLLVFNGTTALVWVRSTFFTSTNTTLASISVSAAPTERFNNQIENTFLPLSWQLLVGPDQEFVDNDNDGVTADEDPDDNDPNVP